MDQLLFFGGRLAGILGLLLCLGAAATRLAGHFWVGGFQLGTLLQAGIALMIAGTFLLLWLLCLRMESRY